MNLVHEFVLFIHRDVAKTINVVIRVELGEVYLLDKVLVYLHALQFLVHTVALDQGVCHFDAERLHRVVVRNLVRGKVFIKVVAHPALSSGVASSQHVRSDSLPKFSHLTFNLISP